jgi:hypothetical protein
MTKLSHTEQRVQTCLVCPMPKPKLLTPSNTAPPQWNNISADLINSAQ